MLKHLLSRLKGAVIAVQFSELLALDACSIPDELRFVVFDGEDGLCCVLGDGTVMHHPDVPEWFDSVKRRGDLTEVEDFISHVMRLKKQKDTPLPDVCSEMAPKASSVAFTDETSGHCLTLVRAKTARVYGKVFDRDVLRYVAPLDMEIEPESAVVCALQRDEDGGLAVKVYS